MLLFTQLMGEPFTIKKSKIRGEESEGMICAEDEIGLGTSHEGIMVLDPSTPVGTLVSDLFQVENDYVIEIGLTPNRTDAMCHIGVARDIAAALHASSTSSEKIFFPQANLKAEASKNTNFKVLVENSEACPRYAGVLIENIKIEESPTWLKNRLAAIGIRSINNVVDITNFVLKEMGQALHAFDANAIKGNTVIVKTLAQNSLFTTLDEVERKLNATDLMICNAQDPMCMAGVFGGLHSGVKASTTSIFLESAYFDSTYIRKTSTTHNLRTDAAQRYEKGADPEMVLPALARACQLIEELAGGKIASQIFDVYPTKLEAKKVDFRLTRLTKLAGTIIPSSKVENILLDLDFQIQKQNDTTWTLTVPLYRADVTREADVIEEVMRIYGFNNIAIPNEVKSTLSFQNGIDVHQMKEKVAHTLNGLGYAEMMTNSITQSKFYTEDSKLVRLQNSMTSELDSMRASLIPEALKVLQHNINRKNSHLKFFEFGNIYLEDHSQEEQLVLFYTGDVQAVSWNAAKKQSTFFHLKGSVESLFNALNIDNYETSIISETEIEISKNNKILASLGKIPTEQKNLFEINQEVFFGIIQWETVLKMLKKQKIKFKELPKFPEVSRDLAVILNEDVSFESIHTSIRKNSSKILKSVDLFDVFRNTDKIGVNKKSYALNFRLQDSEKTLTDKEIDKVIEKIIVTLEQNFEASIRK
jgi:phenylalanyl-tRNA synthetase beta chain